MKRRVPYPEAIENTSHIAWLCREFSLPVGGLHPPSSRHPEQSARKVSILCLKQLARRHTPVPSTYLRQLDREMSVINKLQLADFFLLVKDVVDFAVSRGIRHSVRGSAAGSLVTYLLLGGVDPVLCDDIRGLLRRTAAEGCTVILSSHLLLDVAGASDTVILLDQGQVFLSDLLAVYSIGSTGSIPLETD